MTDIDIDTDGFEDVLSDFEQLENDVAGDDTWLIGTGVEYAIFLESGTRDMDPKPFLQPVVNEVNALGVRGFLARHTRVDIADLDDADALVKALATGMERRIKEIITIKGLIDTGTLRASIKAFKNGTPSDLLTEDDVDPVAEAGVEVGV
ncbi:hypothetical protein ACFQL1_15890 [Halomicroarcula sp. GCM10025709]|uniref:hypothetical protein n=1 Tax=Haloarcula TaxID=2237 RepID=UPI0024C3AF2D|nr:hypothetical protein [Halomicroarcula sp. YJ-61-S]